MIKKIKNVVRHILESNGYIIATQQDISHLHTLISDKEQDVQSLHNLIVNKDKEIKATKDAPGYGLLKTPGIYNSDGLITVHNHDFERDPRFQLAYQRGAKAAGYDYNWAWRVHIGLWAASYASKLTGDFVECGVSYGFLSSSVMDYLNWNKVGKKFYLLDTFQGIDETQLSKEEVGLGRKEQNRFYSECYERVKKNFTEYNNVKIIRGSIPSTLSQVDTSKVCYLSIDLNNVKPEIATAEFFWPKLVKGAVVLLDDYAYVNYLPQKKAFDLFAKRHDISIASLPTGQGLIIK